MYVSISPSVLLLSSFVSLPFQVLYATHIIALLLNIALCINLLGLPYYFVQKYRMEVGTQAMDHLINILQTDRYVAVGFGFLYLLLCRLRLS